VYSQLLAYFQIKYRFAYWGILIAAGCCFMFAGNVRAQTPPTSLDEDNLVTLTPLPSDKSNGKEDLGLDNQDGDNTPLAAKKIAQSVIPVPNINIISPVLPTNLLPKIIQTTPLNSVLAPELIPAPNKNQSFPSVNTPVAPNSNAVRDPRYIIAPQELDPKIVDPFSTQFILNGNRVSHFTNLIATTGYEFGNFRNADLSFDVYKVLGFKNVQSVTTDKVVRVESQIEVGQVRSIAQKQDIDVSVAQPQTLLGFRQQISLDGNCLDGSGRTCTFLPGVKIDESVIDPRKLLPIGARITSQFGDVISPASVTAIREPGFQGGANGEEYGIDIFLPAVGLVEPPEGTVIPLTGERREKFNTGVAVNYTRMNQKFATNGKESTLGRTIRSLNYIDGDRNQLLNLAVNALGQILPDFETKIAPGEAGARIVVNPNLYRAASAIRIPDSSLTVYQSGTGYAVSNGSDPRVPPAASHQALWVGLSPVIEREFSRDFSYITLRPPQIVGSGGGEGGNVPVDVNINGFGFNSSGLSNAYGQGYVTVFNRDVSRVDVETLRQRTDYYPHVSLTGSNLTENTLWRYFTGAIVNAGFQPKATQNIKAYIGTDYSIVNPYGFSLSVGGIGYLNPDPEYNSQFSATATQSIGLGDNVRNNLILGVSSNYIIDGLATIQSLPVRTAQSFVSANASLNFGDISIGGTQFLGNLLPESVESKTVFNVGWKVSDRLKVGGFVSAFDQNISTNPFGASLSYTLDPRSDSSLFVGWNAAAIDFRRTLGPTANVYRDNTFNISLKLGF
jgi:hypothetical protein